MKILLDSVPPDGRTVTADLQTPWAVQAAELALDAPPETLQAALLIREEADCARITGPLAVSTTQTCARCGAAVEMVLKGVAELDYVPEPDGDSEAVQLATDDLDVGWFDGHSLDLAGVVSEQLNLWAPPRVLCGQEGVTRIDPGECALPEQDPGPELKRDNPFAALRKKQ